MALAGIAMQMMVMERIKTEMDSPIMVWVLEERGLCWQAKEVTMK